MVMREKGKASRDLMRARSRIVVGGTERRRQIQTHLGVKIIRSPYISKESGD